ncbi:MAG: 5'/3'-nucleotidase SurE [Synergistes sp.]|nr:5'/3'-nucleotidase SurE [Synergistes sp.]
MKKILLTNDDGVYHEGILTLAKALCGSYEVMICSPDRERSATGHAMTLTRPLHLRKADARFFPENVAAYCCDGMPTDSVVLGVEALHFVPDVLISGINYGPNLSDDITYSGTVCAALEGLVYGFASMAVSLDVTYHEHGCDVHYDTAAAVAVSILNWIKNDPMPEGVMYNVNVPNVSLCDIAGVRMTRFGYKRYVDKVMKVKSQFGGDVYWLGGNVETRDEEGTDVWAAANNYVSITPVSLDMTNYGALSSYSKRCTDDIFAMIKEHKGNMYVGGTR